MSNPGMAKGDERREGVARELRKMRQSFEAALEALGEAAAQVEAPKLDEDLRAAASRKARKRPKKVRGKAKARTTAKSRRKSS